ncbi:MAG: hypothetical protein ACETWM_20420 [Candidatus Lokiarchaeia archaeon]
MEQTQVFIFKPDADSIEILNQIKRHANQEFKLLEFAKKSCMSKTRVRRRIRLLVLAGYLVKIELGGRCNCLLRWTGKPF